MFFNRGSLKTGTHIFLILISFLLTTGISSSVNAIDSSECYFNHSFPESDKTWLTDDAIFSVQEDTNTVVVYGTDVSWRKDIYPLISGIENEAEGKITIVADTLTIDHEIIVNKLKFEIIVDELVVNHGRLLVQDGAQIKNENNLYDPVLKIFTNHINGQLALSTLGSHRASIDNAPVKLSYRTASKNAFDSSFNLGLSPLHPGMCNNCLIIEELGSDSSDEDITEFGEKQSRLAFWAGRRIFISNLINPSNNEKSTRDQLRVLNRLIGNGYESISPAIPNLSVIAKNINDGHDVLGGIKYGIDKNILGVAVDDLARANQSFENDGLVSDILINFSKAKKNKSFNNNTKRQLEKNNALRKKLVVKEDSILDKIANLESEIEVHELAIKENEKTLSGFVEFDAFVAGRKAKKNEQFANAAAGAKLVVTVVGSIYGGWGAAATGAINVGVDVTTAKKLDQKLNITESLKQGLKAYQTAKKLNAAFKIVDNKWKAYGKNRKKLRKARRESNDVKGSWIDAIKLTKKQISAQEKATFKKKLLIFKNMKLKEFTFKPVPKNSSKTNELLKYKAELEKTNLELLKEKATLEVEHLKVTTRLDELDEFARETTFYSSLDSEYEQKTWLLSAALDYVLVDYFKKYYLLKSALHSQYITFDEERLDKTAWTIGFRDYLNLAKQQSDENIEFENFVQGLRVSSTVIMHELSNAINEASVAGFKIPFNPIIDIKGLDDRYIGKNTAGNVNFIKIPDDFLTKLITDNSRASYIVEASLTGAAASDWSIYALPAAYRFYNRRCELISNRNNKWIELGKSIRESEERPFRYHQLYIIPTKENPTNTPDSLKLTGYIN